MAGHIARRRAFEEPYAEPPLDLGKPAKDSRMTDIERGASPGKRARSPWQKGFVTLTAMENGDHDRRSCSCYDP